MVRKRLIMLRLELTVSILTTVMVLKLVVIYSALDACIPSIDLSDMSIITRLPVSLFEFKRNRFFCEYKVREYRFVTSKHVVQDESGKYLGTFSYD